MEETLLALQFSLFSRFKFHMISKLPPSWGLDRLSRSYITKQHMLFLEWKCNQFHFIFPLLPKPPTFCEFSNLAGSFIFFHLYFPSFAKAAPFLRVFKPSWVVVNSSWWRITVLLISPLWLLTTWCSCHWLSSVDITDIADCCNTCKSPCLTLHMLTSCHSWLSSYDYSFYYN